MQQNDIAVLRWCQRYFFEIFQYYDGASDIFLRDFNITMVPGQLFYFFDKKHNSPHWYASRHTNLSIDKSIVQVIFLIFLRETQESPLVRVTVHAIID